MFSKGFFLRVFKIQEYLVKGNSLRLMKFLHRGEITRHKLKVDKLIYQASHTKHDHRKSYLVLYAQTSKIFINEKNVERKLSKKNCGKTMDAKAN